MNMSGFGDFFLNAVAAAGGATGTPTPQQATTAATPHDDDHQDEQPWKEASELTFHAVTQAEAGAVTGEAREAPATPAGVGIA